MSKRFPVTQGTIMLKNLGVQFTEHTYDYQRKGTDIAAEGLGVDLHIVVKTLVMQRDNGEPFMMLMHGDKEVSLKELARQIGAKTVEPCDPKDAQRYTGYMVGGISPFGAKRKLPIYVEESILTLPSFYINGGQRGYIIELSSTEFQKAVDVTPVKVGR